MSTRHLPLIFCFAGQGSQYFQMGAALYREHTVFRHWLEIGDEILRDRHGFSLIREMYAEGRTVADPFDQLSATNPAVFLVQYTLGKVMIHHGIQPDALLGISLGETTAMALSGMVSFEAALHAVSDQPAAYDSACAPGGMTAVLAPSEEVGGRVELDGTLALAGINGNRHFIVAGLNAALDDFEEMAGRQDFPFQRLPVPFAFHSPWIEPAAPAFRDVMPSSLRPSRWPCWSSCLTRPVLPTEPDLFWRIVREPMRFQTTVTEIERQGGAIYLDLSPTGTIAAILRMGLDRQSPSQALSVLSPFTNGMAGFDKALKTVLEVRQRRPFVGGPMIGRVS